jgi:hypothetical protein
MSPNSRAIAPNATEAKTTNLVQKIGTLLFKIERAPARRFAVDTPYLAAVVKGTTFTVTVRGDSGLVHVTEGAVLVASFGSRETALVTPGQTAQVLAAGGKLQVIERGQPVPKAPAGDKSGDKGKDNDKQGSNAVDQNDRAMIEKGHGELKDGDAGTAEARNRRGPNGARGGDAMVIATPVGAESVDVTAATGGFIGSLPVGATGAQHGKGGAKSSSSQSGLAPLGAASPAIDAPADAVAAVGQARKAAALAANGTFGNGNGVGPGNGNGNAFGNGNGNAGGNGNGNAFGNGNGNAGGNGNGNGNAGNNGNGNGNAGGNGNGHH